jgi:hypothetical protein
VTERNRVRRVLPVRGADRRRTARERDQVCLLDAVQLARMQWARRPRSECRVNPLLDARHADALDGRAIDVQRISNRRIPQARTNHTLVNLEQNVRVCQRSGCRLSLLQQLLYSSLVRCARSSDVNVTRYRFTAPHFTGSDRPLGSAGWTVL